MAAPASSRARILAVAREEFAGRGFKAARLQDIAERAGLSHPTLLYHFGSKEGLYSAVIEDAVADWAATTHRVRSTGLRGFDQVEALAFLSREVEAGRLRPHDPIELMQLCYGAMLTYFSDARFRARLIGDDPLGTAERTRFQTALTTLLRTALDPAE